jgi:hypothetical protein
MEVRRGGQSVPIRQSIRKATGRGRFNVDQPFNPSIISTFVPVAGSVDSSPRRCSTWRCTHRT